MEKRVLSLTDSEAQKIFTHLPVHLSSDYTEIVVTHDEQPILTILPYHAHQELEQNVTSLQTMLEIMLGAEQGGEIKPPAPKKPHQPTSWEDFQKEIGW